MTNRISQSLTKRIQRIIPHIITLGFPSNNGLDVDMLFNEVERLFHLINDGTTNKTIIHNINSPTNFPSMNHRLSKRRLRIFTEKKKGSSRNVTLATNQLQLFQNNNGIITSRKRTTPAIYRPRYIKPNLIHIKIFNCFSINKKCVRALSCALKMHLCDLGRHHLASRTSRPFKTTPAHRDRLHRIFWNP